jgi:alpha-ribazole phosphatase
MRKRLLLIRHAAIEKAEGVLMVGATDVPAGSSGMRDLERLVGVLSGFTPKMWFSSPLLRARQTVAQLRDFQALTQEVTFDERLREIDFGRWEMKSFPEIATSDPELIQGWAEYEAFTFPGGESVHAFCARVADFLADLRKAAPEEIAVVAHGGVIRTLICLALGLTPKKYLLFDVRPGRLAVLDLHEEGGVLSGLNL